MIENILHTLKKQNYSAIAAALRDPASLAQNTEMIEALQRVLDDHKAVTTAAFRLIAKQRREAKGIFAALEKSEPLFPRFDDEDSADDEEKPEAGPDKGSEKKGTHEGEEEKPNRRKTRLKPAIKISHSLKSEQLKCPCCSQKMHRAHQKTITIIRMQGFSEERHEIETARCLTCSTKVEAEAPKEKTLCQFAIPAAAAIISLRYAYGVPSFRLEEVSKSMGYRIPDSTQWDLFESAANELQTFFRFLKKEASKADVTQMDDTTVRINSLTHEFKLRKDGTLEGVKDERTGVHTTGFVAKFAAGKICFFESGLHHAGEVFEKLMKDKSLEDEVILMMDASSSNTSRIKNLKLKVVQANCNSHVVRKFDDLVENPVFEQEAEYILTLYGEIFSRDKELKKGDPLLRQQEHKLKSLPQMEQIKKKIESDFQKRRVEPSSELGSAYKYFLNHFEKLCAFCNHVGAPICNNECERLLKRAIRHRKNSLFFSAP